MNCFHGFEIRVELERIRKKYKTLKRLTVRSFLPCLSVLELTKKRKVTTTTNNLSRQYNGKASTWRRIICSRLWSLRINNMRKMIFKCFVVLFFLQAVIGERTSPRRTSAGKRQIFSFGFHENNPIQKLTESGKSEMQGSKRSRRFLTSTLSLLWPQVFGPVDQGYIEERSYDEVPKTLLEYRLDMLRKKAQEEEETRLVIRNYMKSLTEAQDKFYGYPNNGEPGFAVMNYI